MHKVFHTLEIEAFSYPTEDIDKVEKSFQITGFEPKVSDTSTEDMKILKAKEERHGKITDFVELLKQEMDEDELEEICRTLEDRVDEEGNFFIRLDKQEALDEEYVLSEGSDIQVRLKISSFPSSREKAIEKARGVWCEDEFL